MALENTHFGYEKIRDMMMGGRARLFFAGVGGVSMSSLAKVAALRGHPVAGYDRAETDLTRKLREEGVTVCHTSEARFADEADAVVYTVAMSADDPVIKRARETGKPLISRADFLGYVMTDYPVRVGVSGMHGKSTTTAVAASVFEAAGREPTVFGGARMRKTGECNIIGRNECFVFEACEYMGSFLDFNPTVAIVLNVEMDHPDYFTSVDMIVDHFAAFMKKARLAVVNGENENAMRAARLAGVRTVTFGRGGGFDYSLENPEYLPRSSNFDIYKNGVFLTHAGMKIPGRHIVLDAVAAAAAASECGVSPDAISRGLRDYSGVMRRMEQIGAAPCGAAVIDDYAHHPTELKATLDTVAGMEYGRTRVAFQPHTFSRTKELFDDFVSVLSSSCAERTVLLPIYPARETDDLGVSSELIARAMRERGADAVAVSSFEEAAAILTDGLGADDCVLVAGAGDVDRLAPMIVNGK